LSVAPDGERGERTRPPVQYTAGQSLTPAAERHCGLSPRRQHAQPEQRLGVRNVRRMPAPVSTSIEGSVPSAAATPILATRGTPRNWSRLSYRPAGRPSRSTDFIFGDALDFIACVL